MYSSVAQSVAQRLGCSDMRNELRKDCPMRHENGNCTTVGGFCTAVNDQICEALHNAFNCGEQSKIEWATLVVAEQSRLFAEKQLDVMRDIHAKVTSDAVEVVRCKECLSERQCKFAQYQGMNGYCSLGERICDECVECDYYWANNDTGEECQGLAKPCHEFIPKRGL